MGAVRIIGGFVIHVDAHQPAIGFETAGALNVFVIKELSF
jgi:hypothetical protein